MKPRVLVISVDAIPGIGGVAAFAHYLSNSFCGFCAETVFLGPAGTASPYGMSISYKIIEDIKSKPSVRSGAKFFSEKNRITELLRKIIIKYNLNKIVLVHPFYYGPAAVDVGRELKIPVDVVVHGTELTSQFPKAATDAVTHDSISVESLPFHLFRTLSGATRIIANSRRTAHIAANIAPNALVCVSGCGIDLDELEKIVRRSVSLCQKAQLRLAHGRSERPELCYIGRLVRHKRVERAFELLIDNDWRLRIIGDGPMRSHLEARATEMGVISRVHFHGAVDDDEKWRLLEASDFLVLPSTFDPETGGYEGFGIVMLEAIAAGVVPVSSGADGMADPVHLYRLGLEGLSPNVSARDALVRMQGLLDNEEAYQAKTAADLKIVREQFTWRAIAENIAAGW